MKNYIEKTRVVVEQKLLNITCDRCGKIIKKGYMVEVERIDGIELNYDICTDCHLVTMNTFYGNKKAESIKLTKVEYENTREDLV